MLKHQVSFQTGNIHSVLTRLATVTQSVLIYFAPESSVRSHEGFFFFFFSYIEKLKYYQEGIILLHKKKIMFFKKIVKVLIEY